MVNIHLYSYDELKRLIEHLVLTQKEIELELSKRKYFSGATSNIVYNYLVNEVAGV
jgi:hypothetical protein